MHKLSFQNVKSNYFYYALILFVCSLPLSEFMVSVSGGILLITAWAEDSWINKIKRIKKRKILIFIPSVFFIYLFSALLFQNSGMVLYDLKKALFFIIIPLAFLVGKDISSQQKQTLLVFFTISVIIAVFYAFLNWKIFGKSEYLHIHNASLITHIRFSFQLILAIWFLVFWGIKSRYCSNKITLGVLLSILFLVGFLFLQFSLTGIISFFISLIFVFLISVFFFKGILKYTSLIVILFLTIIPVVYVLSIAYPFYFPNEIKKENLPEITKNGNRYTHDNENRLIENGNFVYLYVCEKEMREEWNKKSTLKYDSLDQYGYTVKSTLVRYLTSKGLTKDSEGVIALTNSDIENIKNGVSNYLFVEKKWSVFPRVYKSIWEFYVYTKLGYVNNQSLSQRIEFSRAAISIIKENFWFGVGTGNWKQSFFDAYKKMGSKLDENYYASSHNQYLNYLVKFGVFGFLLIMFFIVYPIIKTKRYRDPLFLVFLVFMFVANFADSNFESHMGSSFFVFFYCFFLITDSIDYLSSSSKHQQN